MKFNEQQQKAIDFYEGACAVIAGAGSGKSTVLINRIKNLIEKHNVPQSEILAISFTRNTADELKGKLDKMGYVDVNVGTFHSICARIMAKEGVYFTPDKMIKDWQIEKALITGDKKIDIDDVKSFISYQKNYLRGYKDIFMKKDSVYCEEDLINFYHTYEKYKKNASLHDFDDYLLECYYFLKENPHRHTFDFVLVDEHQDSNLVQNLILKEICKTGNMFCVFDYRQAIYTFRGGNPEYCMNFTKEWDHASVINLDINYRSSRSIVNKANGFIERYYGEYEYYSNSIPEKKDIGNVEVKSYDDREQEGIDTAEHIENLLSVFESPKEIVVLYRLNSHSSYVEHELRKRGIEYDIANDSSFFKRKEISGILAYLRLIISPHDDGAFFEIIKLRNYPLTYFSDSLMNEIKRFAGVNNLSMFEALGRMRYANDWQQKNANKFIEYIMQLKLQKEKNVDTVSLVENIIRAFQITEYIDEKYSNEDEKKDRLDSLLILKSFIKSDSPEKFLSYVTTTKKKNKDCVKLMTIHASKGLEFKHVFLVGVEDGKFPHDRSELIDEVRLFYVGVTRPKDNLYISQIGEDNKFIKEYM